MLLKVMERWELLQILPEKGNLATMNIVNNLRQRLGTTAKEQEDLEMTIGVVCNECGNPVEDRAEEGEKPHYYCIVCDKFVDDTKGLPERTIWNSSKDTGKNIKFESAERGIIITAFNKLDKDENATPQQAILWDKFRKEYPSKATEGKED